MAMQMATATNAHYFAIGCRFGQGLGPNVSYFALQLGQWNSAGWRAALALGKTARLRYVSRDPPRFVGANLSSRSYFSRFLTDTALIIELS
jgi:hypothetical protein